jgi:hypothetical protein
MENERRETGRTGASGASSTFLRSFLSMRVCCRSVASHARLLARSTPGGAASGAFPRGLRPHCGAAESGFMCAIPPNGSFNLIQLDSASNYLIGLSAFPRRVLGIVQKSNTPGCC